MAPVYLSEIAPIRLRGALGVLNQFGIVIGILVGFIFGLKQVGNMKPYFITCGLANIFTKKLFI